MGLAGSLQEAEAFVRITLRDARRVFRSFCALGDLPSGHVPMLDPLPRLLCEHWVLLKRRLWNQGLLDAAGSKPYLFGEVRASLDA